MRAPPQAVASILAYDAQHHKQTAYTTRKRATMTADLFDAA